MVQPATKAPAANKVDEWSQGVRGNPVRTACLRFDAVRITAAKMPGGQLFRPSNAVTFCQCKQGCAYRCADGHAYGDVLQGRADAGAQRHGKTHVLTDF